MSALALLLVLGAGCPAAEGRELSPEQEATLCALPTTVAQGAVSPEALGAIYARPEFSRAHGGQSGDLLKRLKAWLEKVFETSGAETYSNLTRVVVLLLAAFVVIAVVVRLSGRRRAKQAAVEATPSLALPLADPSVHLERARALAAQRPRDGAREGLLAILAALEQQRLARPDRVKTNRELARELPGRGAPKELVDAITAQLTWFDRAWYSLEPLDAARVHQFLDAAAALVSRVSAFGGQVGAR
ncbi:MAG: DUF4129 domain-containing protein [Myxococcus sp.]|nr:DUF4129 domain-containing protein [Myxococcus sp.]